MTSLFFFGDNQELTNEKVDRLTICALETTQREGHIVGARKY